MISMWISMYWRRAGAHECGKLERDGQCESAVCTTFPGPFGARCRWCKTCCTALPSVFTPAWVPCVPSMDDDVLSCDDVQTLRGEHLSRCIGRLAGKVRIAAGKFGSLACAQDWNFDCLTGGEDVVLVVWYSQPTIFQCKQ